jgi:serine/threonine protein kinase
MSKERVQEMLIELVTKNYDERISHLVSTSTLSANLETKSNTLQTKNGVAYMLESKEAKFSTHVKQINIHRGNLHSIEQEIKVLKTLGLYKGHFINNEAPHKLFLYQQGFSENWYDLEHKNHAQASRPENLPDLVHENIEKITRYACKDLSLLYDAGFYHNDLNNGNILVKTNVGESDILDVKIIDFDAASSRHSLIADSSGSTYAIVSIIHDIDNESTEQCCVNKLRNVRGLIYETNKITDAKGLFYLMKSNIQGTNPELEASIKQIILKEYLLKIYFKAPINKTTNKLKLMLQQSTLSNKHSMITISSNNNLMSLKNELTKRANLITNLKSHSLFRNSLSEFENQTFSVVMPHNTLGHTSKSRFDIITLSASGEILQQRVYEMKSNSTYSQGIFGRFYKQDQKSADILPVSTNKPITSQLLEAEVTPAIMDSQLDYKQESKQNLYAEFN